MFCAAAAVGRLGHGSCCTSGRVRARHHISRCPRHLRPQSGGERGCGAHVSGATRLLTAVRGLRCDDPAMRLCHPAGAPRDQFVQGQPRGPVLLRTLVMQLQARARASEAAWRGAKLNAALTACAGCMRVCVRHRSAARVRRRQQSSCWARCLRDCQTASRTQCRACCTPAHMAPPT